MKFESPLFAKCLGDRGITGPTEIQKLVMPLIASGKNVIFCSATGTGKTFAYLIPMLEKIAGDVPETGGPAPKRSGPALMICAPTHELCAQIKNEAGFLIGGMEGSGDLSVLSLAGSGSIKRQIEALKKRPALVVGNPGRLLALARQGKLKTAGIRRVVLDEGDRLVSDELFEETAALAALLDRSVQRVSCSATFRPASRKRIEALFRQADGAAPADEMLFVETSEQEILRNRIRHWAFFCERRRKINTLLAFLAAAKPKKALVFSDGGGQPGIILARLRHGGIRAAGLYSGLDKKARKAAIDGFRSGKIAALVSSDLAARGLDVPDITHVIALDVPAEEGPYIHRAGRTARAGKRGIMVTIGDADEMRRLVRLEKKMGIAVYPKELYGGRVGDIREDSEE
ncbi:MAG: DEAD/DEAH box helicase [Spirochaetaceae bacterium]|nr:DEAD/DEAH box helicase [Spirochaetaceae bacterium]